MKSLVAAVVYSKHIGSHMWVHLDLTSFFLTLFLFYGIYLLPSCYYIQYISLHSDHNLWFIAVCHLTGAKILSSTCNSQHPPVSQRGSHTTFYRAWGSSTLFLLNIPTHI